MTPERWQRVHEVFSTALDADPQQREAEVRKACAEDSSLQAEVLELLLNHEKATTECFLELPPWIVEEVPVTLPDFDDYEQIECVGHGGMGVVYKAFQRSLDRWVATKMSLPSRLAADDDQRRFRAEAESMAKLRHANIVRVHDVGDHDGRPYFCMELVDGESLATQLSRFRDRPRASAQLLATVARAVQHAHLRGVLHRDLKPENVLIDEEGQPHISDFGLAKRLDDGDAPRGIVGTAGYMSPEQADPERDETALSDVYGLGAIFYALLAGRAPHRGSDYQETLRLVRQRSPDSPRTLNPQVDRDLETICLKCLSHDAQQRYPSAGALADDLERWLEGRETSARPWSRRERWRAWLRPARLFQGGAHASQHHRRAACLRLARLLRHRDRHLQIRRRARVDQRGPANRNHHGVGDD